METLKYPTHTARMKDAGDPASFLYPFASLSHAH